MSLKSVNPATGETIRAYNEMSTAEIDRAIVEANAQFTSWRETTFEHRASLMRRAADVLRDGADGYAELMAREMGKPLREGRGEAQKCAWVCEHYAQHAEEYLASETVETDATKSYVAFRPLGVVLAVMPWNFPFWQVFRFAAPALMAGNAGLLKHASNVMGCALAIEQVFELAGFPKGLFRTLAVGAGAVESVVGHDLVRAVTLTGSTPAGRAVAAAAGARLKKTVLELGGSDPYLILEDADLEQAAELCAISRLLNSGQSCIAAKRFVVVDAARDRSRPCSLSACVPPRWATRSTTATTIGPLARADLRDELHDRCEERCTWCAVSGRRRTARRTRRLLSSDGPRRT